MKTIIKLSTLIVLTFGQLYNANGQDSLITKTFLAGQIQLSIPKSFKQLDDKSISEKFPNPNSRPSVFLIDNKELSSLKIIEMPQNVSDNEVGQYKSFHMTQMKKETNIKWLGDNYKKINGKNVGIIKVIYTDRNTFAYFFFTSLKGKLLLLTFNCEETLWPTYEETAELIVNSLKVE